VGGIATLTAALTNGSTGATLQWQSGTSTTGPWTDVSGATGTTYNAPSGTAGTFYYRVRVIDNGSGCADPNSNAVTVLVRDDAQISIVVDNAEVCIDGTANLTATLTNGSTQASLQWQIGTSSTGPWTDIGGQTNTIYSASTSTAGIYYYRVRVIDPLNGCSIPNSNVVTVTVREDAEVTADVNNAEVCVGGSALLTADLSGGSAAATYQWQSSGSITGPWADVSGATGVSYDAPTGAAGTFYYRVRIIDPSSGCETPVSNSVTVIVQPDAVIDASVDNAEVCLDGLAVLTAALTGGSTSAVLIWQNSSNAGGPFVDIPGATGASYSAPTDQIGVIYYRVRVDDPGSDCADPNSNAVSVTVREDATILAQVDNAEVCVGGLATLTATLSNGSTGATLQWQSGTSTTGPWTDISNATNASYNAPSTVSGTFFYRVRVIDPNSGCAAPLSDAVTVIVRPDATISANVNNAQVCVGGVATLTASLTGGSTSATLQWQSGTSTTGPWTDISGATGVTYAASTAATGTFYYRVSVLDPVNGCATPSSAAVTVVVRPDAQITAVVNNPEICVGGNATLTATLTGGSTTASLQWQSGTSISGPWTDLAGQTSVTYVAPSTVAGDS
jgi:uncharacterized protein (UPF0179 family)